MTDNVITIVSLIAYSIPIFWMGQMLLLVLSLNLGLFPIAGMYSLRVELTGIPQLVDVLHHVFLPALSLGYVDLALYARLTRSNMIDVLRKDFILNARAKGLDEKVILYKHALRNALLPVITVCATRSGWLVGGAILAETVYNWPGIGRLMYDSLYARDYPVLMGIFVIVGISVILINLIADIVYVWMDPRIRYT